MLNMLLLNNIMDRGNVIVGTIFCVTAFFGLNIAFYGKLVLFKDMLGTSFGAMFVFALVIIILYMYIQKRVIKEIFME